MAPVDINPIKIARANEQLRQEREIFDQTKKQQNRKFILSLVMGYSAVILFFVIIIISGWILYHNTLFNSAILTMATTAIFVDSLGLITTVWKLVLNPSALASIQPVTQENLPD